MPEPIKIKSNLPNDYVKIVKHQIVKPFPVQFKKDFKKHNEFGKLQIKIMKIYF